MSAVHQHHTILCYQVCGLEFEKVSSRKGRGTDTFRREEMARRLCHINVTLDAGLKVNSSEWPEIKQRTAVSTAYINRTTGSTSGEC